MAERLDSFEFFRGRPGSSKYRWAEWFDGSVWRLTQGVDFKAKPTDMRTLCYGAAAKRGGKLHTAVDGKTLVIQFYVPDEVAS